MNAFPVRAVGTLLLVLPLGCPPVEASTGGVKAPAADVAARVVTVRDVRERDPKASVELRPDGETLHVDVISPSGIGGVRLALTAGRWPKKVVVHLRYSKDRPFTRLEGSGASLEGADANEKAEPITLRKVPAEGAAGFDFDVPEATAKKVMSLNWIDAYR